MSTTRIARIFAAAAIGLGACAQQMQDMDAGQQVRLWGSNEVPPADTQAYGTGVVYVMPDRSVSVTLSVVNMVPTAAHIHQGAVGTNGPVIVPLFKISENAFVAPDSAKLTEAQYTAYKAGNLYINAHSAKYPGGEVRAQLAGRP